MPNEVDVAVLKVELQNLHETMRNQTELLKEISTQTKKTNGRVTRLEVRHEQEDLQHYPDKIEKFGKFQTRVLAICAIVPLLTSMGMGVVLKYAVDSYIEQQTIVAIEEVLATYDFNVTE